MPDAWNDKYKASLTRKCLTANGYGSQQGAPQAGTAAKDPEIRYLLKLECSLGTLPEWAREITNQIALLPAQGWAMPHCIEAICQNIGASDPEKAKPSASYRIGPHRLQLMADYAICLDGWLKALSPETISARTSETSLGWRDWEFIARRIQDALGLPSLTKALLVRRLLAKLKFWLRAAQMMQTDEQLATEAQQHVAVAANQHLLEMAELDHQIRQNVMHGQRWLELIDSAWPGAARIFHYIERMMAAIGEMDANPDAWPDELVDVDLEPPGSHADYQSAEAGRILFDTVMRVLDAYLDNPAATVDPRAPVDAKWADRLTRRLGKPTPIGAWLVGLTRKRFALLAANTKQMV
jgi:hypothetical protein